MGVIRGRLQLAYCHDWEDETKKSYALVVWELVDENRDDKVITWKYVHFHKKIVLKFECSILTMHLDDGDAFFFSNYDEENTIEIFQCGILGKNHIHVETLGHMNVFKLGKMI
uniref:Uncharacterized protein n=1 Tax=Cannabis sativa TaxID=3483 RepID=A0A803QAP2_CANSA